MLVQEPIRDQGNELIIRIPKSFVQEMGLRSGMIAEIRMEGKSIVISNPQTKYRTLEEIMEGYDGAYLCTELQSGPPVGDEVF